MPLKYVWDQPLAVRYTGWAHGILFMLYGLAWLEAWFDRRWGPLRALLIFLAAVFPFGPFVAERVLAKEDQAGAAPGDSQGPDGEGPA